MKKTLLAASALAVAMTAAPAHAALNVPIPTNAYITQGGLDWAWAIPLPASAFPNALSYQGSQGWRLPTMDELLNAPDAVDFLFPGGNVPFGGTDPVSGSFFSAVNGNYTGAGACAAAYFNSSYQHCDWQDGQGQPYQPWAGLPGAQTFADQLFVRVAQPGVPEPATWLMMILGFGLIGSVMRRRTKVSVRYA